MNGSPDNPSSPVSRRLVLLFPGFEAMPAEAHGRRFVRELRKTAPVYGFDVSADIPVLALGTEPAMCRVEVAAVGEGWVTATEVVVFGFEGMSAVYASRNAALRLLDGLAALGDFILSGAFFRFLATSWRYGLFFLYPIFMLAAVIVAAWLVFSAVAAFGEAGVLGAIGAALAAAGLLLWLAARKMHLLLIMDDWSFARDIARGARPDIKARLDAVSDAAARQIAAAEADEIVFAAHSFGAIIAVSTLASLTRQEASLATRCGLLTVGSSLLKIALHPAASRLRSDVETVVRGDYAWLDVQSLTDPINFYKTNPPRDLGIKGGRPVQTMRVRFRHQLDPETYRSIRRDLFRVHRQFVYGVERRTAYSFHAILCGPEPFADVARRPGLPERWDFGISSQAGGGGLA